MSLHFLGTCLYGRESIQYNGEDSTEELRSLFSQESSLSSHSPSLLVSTLPDNNQASFWNSGTVCTYVTPSRAGICVSMRVKRRLLGMR